MASSTSDAPPPDATQHVAQLEPQFSLLAQHLELPDREWVDVMDNFRASYENELPLLKDENASLRSQLETAVSRIDTLEQQLKELLESFTGSKATEFESRPVTADLPEKVNNEAVM